METAKEIAVGFLTGLACFAILFGFLALMGR
jgi:hypothetical protein